MERDIKQIISQMTLEEKAGMCSGEDFWHLKSVERLGIPAVMVSDGPHGLRKQPETADHLGMGESIVAVCFPAACAVTSSFDTELIHEMGETLGEECQAEDISVLLGPAVNIKRSPLCGRNFEYMSEDPYLAGKMAAAYIDGVQSRGVGTSIKHYAANNQEYNRMSCSSNMSERTLREIYLPAFEMAVKEAQPKTIMCSYNKINGVYASENRHLLTEILRDEWGFEGYVMTDWGAVSDRVKGIEAGLDLEMPGSGGFNDAKIIAAVKDGSLDEALLDIAVERILKVVFSYIDNRHAEAVFDRDADHEKAVKIETESAVLLENNGVLPLTADAKVVYIGEYAAKPRYQGGGSSHINSSKVSSALESAKAKNRAVTYVKGFPFDKDEENEEELKAAVQAAKEAETAVIFAGLPDVIESEGYDRKDMKLPACQNKLIEAVAQVQPNTVVVLHNGSPVETPWADKAAAVLEMYLGGQGVGEATDKILYGEANPSGRLAETFPLHLEDNPSYLNFPGDGDNVDYAEGVYVGYRYYDTKKMPVRWAFGHGLSYTTYEYSNLKMPTEALNDDNCVKITVDVKNVGNMAGKEVVQLYVSDKNGTPGRPVKELKGFAKVALAPKETKTVEFILKARDLSFYHEGLGDWYAPSGKYEVLVGHACDEIILRGELTFETKKLPPLYVNGATTIGQLLAHPVTAPVVGEMMKSMQQSMQPQGADAVDAESAAEALGTGTEMMEAMMTGMPLKSIASFAGAEMASKIEELMGTLNQMLGN
ncbi:MAG: glycoside hydrolase family 3 C-terminal domain-containing protein [Butyrivibrio sp.]|nr:glycoside hydrolase family 3 C-terminal domain-containing protein [Butyrivibrio sp.]